MKHLNLSYSIIKYFFLFQTLVLVAVVWDFFVWSGECFCLAGFFLFSFLFALFDCF